MTIGELTAAGGLRLDAVARSIQVDARMTEQQRRALAMLADAGVSECNEAAMVAAGIDVDTLAGLVRAGLATATPQTTRAGVKTIEVSRVEITAAGRDALAGARWQPRRG